MKGYKKAIQAATFVIALGLIVLGLSMDGFRDVLSKAVMICMECIGIG